MLKEAFIRILKRDSEIEECQRLLGNVAIRMKKARRLYKTGRISKESFERFSNEKHLGRSKNDWCNSSHKFISSARMDVQKEINKIITGLNSTTVNILIIMLIAFSFLMHSPSFTGFTVLQESNSIGIEFSSDESIVLPIKEITA